MRGLAALTSLAAVACGGDPSGKVALPPADASAGEVVRAYVDAIIADDLETARQLLTPAHASSVEETWFNDVESISDLRVDRPFREKPRWSGRDVTSQVVHVPVEFTLEGGDVSLEEGPMDWGYLLVRESHSDRWLIFDEGTG